MYCPECGSRASSSDAKFCMTCGTKFPEVHSQAQPNIVSAEPSQGDANETDLASHSEPLPAIQRNRHAWSPLKTVLFFLSMIATSVALILIAWLVFGDGEDLFGESEPGTSRTSSDNRSVRAERLSPTLVRQKIQASGLPCDESRISDNTRADVYECTISAQTFTIQIENGSVFSVQGGYAGLCDRGPEDFSMLFGPNWLAVSDSDIVPTSRLQQVFGGKLTNYYTFCSIGGIDISTASLRDVYDALR